MRGAGVGRALEIEWTEGSILGLFAGGGCSLGSRCFGGSGRVGGGGGDFCVKLGIEVDGWFMLLACLTASSLDTNPDDDPGFGAELFDDDEKEDDE